MRKISQLDWNLDVCQNSMQMKVIFWIRIFNIVKYSHALKLFAYL